MKIGNTIMKLLKHKWLLALGLLLIIAVVVGFTYNRTPPSQYFTARAQRTTINDVVQATGTINAVITVQVGSQVSGTISQLFADFNSRVRQGQVVARIEPSLFEGALLQAKADLQNARATLSAARAELEKAKATAVQTRADYRRAVGLTKEGVMSQQQLDLAQANADTASATVSSAEAAVKQAAAQVSLKAAAVAVAQTNLDHTIIHAPINGTVVARNVDVGQTVAASLQAPTLFNIAQDLTKMQVDTQTDESDVGNIRVGQEATFTVDAYPNESFRGRVVQIRLNPTIVQNVVTYDTVIAFENPQLKLFPGMTAYVTIPVATAEDVLSVPNTALRFKPAMSAERVRALYAQYGIGEEYATAARSSRPANPPAAGLQGPRQPRRDVAVIWKLRPDRSLQPVMVRTGITDHTQTAVAELLKGALLEGDELAIGEELVNSRPSGPGMVRH
ncbi:MAG TPA: efflux RND transporter periplasmic adaptor subunit [Terriglobales bacterium]|nr:efflux RND transporter periplasmic adaptor subunit [Terriglobales bacterium]